MPRPRRIVASTADTQTARWLDRALRTTKLHSMLQNAVSHKLPKSAAAGLVEDHVQEAYLRWLEQDALSRHLDNEEAPAPSNLRWWAVKNAYKDIRAFGREPLMRATIGARTETDLKREKAGLPPVPQNLPPFEVVLTEDGITVKASPQEVVTMSLDADDRLVELRQKLIKAGVGRVGDAVAVVIALSDGASYAEAAEEVGITTADAKLLMAEVRAVMQ